MDGKNCRYTSYHHDYLMAGRTLLSTSEYPIRSLIQCLAYYTRTHIKAESLYYDYSLIGINSFNSHHNEL